MRYAHPGTPGALVSFKSAYGNYIDGQFVEPLGGEYFMNTSPVDGSDIAQFPRSDAKDIDFALDAAHRAAEAWGKTSVQHRSNLLLQVADRIQENLEYLAIAESWDNGKPVRETLNADLPLAVDHFRYFAGCLRAQEGSTAEIDETTVAYHFHEPLGVVGQIIPWNFPLLMAAWKLAPALAAGNCVVLKPAEQTPLSITLLLEIIGDLFSPNIYFADVMDGEEEFIEKAVEGLVLGFFNQGEVCTCPSRALIHESIYEPFMERVMAKVAQIRRGDPFDTDTMIGAQASRQQFDKILSYIKIAREEGGQILTGGERASITAELDNGYYIQPTLIKGRNDMRSFQEEIFGPVIGVTTFKDEAEALEIANQTQFGLGAGVWTRDSNLAYRMGRGIKAGRVWTNCYHVYPAHAAFGGYKQSGVGRETHKMALDAYQQTKNLLVSYGTAPLGLF